MYFREPKACEGKQLAHSTVVTGKFVSYDRKLVVQNMRLWDIIIYQVFSKTSACPSLVDGTCSDSKLHLAVIGDPIKLAHCSGCFWISAWCIFSNASMSLSRSSSDNFCLACRVVEKVQWPKWQSNS